ncbi:MAG: HD-GYP domain-containing protein [Fimbriimonadaceae bacterium]
MPKRKDRGAFVGFVGVPAISRSHRFPGVSGWVVVAAAALAASWLLGIERPAVWFGLAVLAIASDAVAHFRLAGERLAAGPTSRPIPLRAPFVVLAALLGGWVPVLILEAALAALTVLPMRAAPKERMKALVLELMPRWAGLFLAVAVAGWVSGLAWAAGREWLGPAAASAAYVSAAIGGCFLQGAGSWWGVRGVVFDVVVLIGVSWAAWAFVSAGSAVLLGLCLFPILALEALRETDRLFADQHFGTITGLSLMLQGAHPHTHRHLARVADMAESVAQRLGMSPEHARRVREASILHDIGKIAVDEAILDKPGPLTDEEYEHVKTHAVYGAQILEPVAEFRELSRWIRWHHERLDGKGYPDGLPADQIPIESRIIAVVDAFDAMTSGLDGGEARPYRKPVPVREALAELRRCAGTQFDPRVVEAFEAAIQETLS